MNEQQATEHGEHPSEREVISYLRTHPEFFCKHEHLLAELTLPHPDTGGAVSLVERQMVVLRQQKHELGRKLQGLAEVARANEGLLERLQRLILSLIDSTELDSALQTLQRALHEDFQAEAVQIFLFSAEGEGAHLADPGDERLRAFDKLLTKARPVCGHLHPEQLKFLFGTEADRIASGAVIPLCEQPGGACVGLIGIGSSDPRRFHPEMGTVFLDHLGAVAARVLHSHLKG